MGDVFMYWDNSNIFIAARYLAAERNSGPNAYGRVRIHFANMLRLAHADRPVRKALAAGSIPPEQRLLWNRLANEGVEVGVDMNVYLYNRNAPEYGEQEVPDRVLQLRMLEDALDHKPGIAVLLTGDGAGYEIGQGFHRTLERMHGLGWKVEVLSWKDATNRRMRQWVEENGIFVELDDFYDSITFLGPSSEPSRPGHELARSRDAAPLDLSRRPVS